MNNDKVREVLKEFVDATASSYDSWILWQIKQIRDKAVKALSSDPWQLIETKPPFMSCYEKGEYRTDDGSLYYFKPTHWQSLPNPPEKK